MLSFCRVACGQENISTTSLAKFPFEGSLPVRQDSEGRMLQQSGNFRSIVEADVGLDFVEVN